MMWFRMYHEFSTDPKVQMLSEVDQRRYVMLLCLKCFNGDVTFQDETVTFQLRINGEEWTATKARLLAKNLIGNDNQPSNWVKRQYASDTSSQRVLKHRERLKRGCNVSETPPEADTESDTERKKEVIPNFKTGRAKGGVTMLQHLGALGFGDGGWPDGWQEAAMARCSNDGRLAAQRLKKCLWYYTEGGGRDATALADRWDKRVWNFLGPKKQQTGSAM